MEVSLNPLKRVNSILTDLVNLQIEMSTLRLNPLKRVNSILTLTELRKTQVKSQLGLNPLKRVNSILTRTKNLSETSLKRVSQSPQTGQFNSYTLSFALPS